MTVGAPTHVLRVKLQDEPSIVREIELPSDRKLINLAQCIVRAFGFDFDHAFGFYSALKGNVLRSQPKYELFADMETSDMGMRTDASEKDGHRRGVPSRRAQNAVPVRLRGRVALRCRVHRRGPE